MLSSSIESVSGRSESRSSALARFGVIVGSSWKPIAAAPATIGAAIEVPPARMYSPPSLTQSVQSCVYAEPGARLETILRARRVDVGLREAVLRRAAARPAGRLVVGDLLRALVVDRADA